MLFSGKTCPQHLCSPPKKGQTKSATDRQPDNRGVTPTCCMCHRSMDTNIKSFFEYKDKISIAKFFTTAELSIDFIAP